MTRARGKRLLAALLALLSACLCPSGTVTADELELPHHWRAFARALD